MFDRWTELRAENAGPAAPADGMPSAAPTGVHHATCPRCGTSGGGAAWCPKCGLNLRIRSSKPAGDGAGTESHAAAAEEPKRRPPQSGPGRRRDEFEPGRGRIVVFGSLAAVLLVGVVVAVVLITGHSKSSDTAAHGQVPAVPSQSAEPTAPPPTATATALAAPVVKADDMAGVLTRYERAYSNEDVAALAALFASDLVRQNGSDAPQGRAGALETYQQQFDQLVSPNYHLSGMRFAPGAREGTAAGTYSITSQNGTVSGQIRFHLVLQDGQLLIDRITISPN